MRFFDKAMELILRHVDFDVVKCVLVGSPGFVAEVFLKYVMEAAVVRGIKPLLHNKAKLARVHVSCGQRHALREMLADASVQSRLSNMKAAREIRALDTFMSKLQHQSERVCYGPRHIQHAADLTAIQTLMITDELFRCVSVSGFCLQGVAASHICWCPDARTW